MLTRRSLFGLALLPIAPKLPVAPTPVAEQFGQIMAQEFPVEWTQITFAPYPPYRFDGVRCRAIKMQDMPMECGQLHP